MSEQGDVAKVSEVVEAVPQLKLPTFKNCDLGQVKNEITDTHQVDAAPNESEELQSKDSFDKTPNCETNHTNVDESKQDVVLAHTRIRSHSSDLTSSEIFIGSDYQTNQNVTEEIFEVPQLNILCFQTCPKQSNDNTEPKNDKLPHNNDTNFEKENFVEELQIPNQDNLKTESIFNGDPRESKETTLPKSVINHSTVRSPTVDGNQPENKSLVNNLHPNEVSKNTAVKNEFKSPETDPKQLQNGAYPETEKYMPEREERISPASDFPTSLTSSFCRCQGYRKRQNDQDYFEDSLTLNESFSSAFSYQGEYQDDDPVFFTNSSYCPSPSIDNSGNSLYRLIGDTACSSPDPDQNVLTTDTDDLEYEYEPGISLSNLEFGRSSEDQISNDLATVFARTKCPFCGSDYESDLQLAAELGKTLLERNKSLENSIKQQQAIIDDQAQEIEYLTKQTAVLRDVNDSRLKIYEQLEVSISELEVANKKLSDENNADKAMIKMLCGNIERVETRCDDLQRTLDEARLQQTHQQRRRRRRSSRSREESKEQPEGDETRQKRQTRESEDRDTDSPSYDGGPTSARFVETSNTSTKSFFRHQVSNSSSSSSPISSSGYSSSSVDSNLQRFSADSDSEPTSISSKTNSAENECALLSVCEENDVHDDSSESSSHVEEPTYEFLRLECIESRERLSEMDRALSGLQSENHRLRMETDQLKNSSESDSLRSVDDEVQDVTCVRSGRLCRKCLGLVDATPGALLNSAFGLMADTLKDELKELLVSCHRRQRWASSRPWLDITLLGLATLAITIAIANSMLQAVGLL